MKTKHKKAKDAKPKLPLIQIRSLGEVAKECLNGDWVIDKEVYFPHGGNPLYRIEKRLRNYDVLKLEIHIDNGKLYRLVKHSDLRKKTYIERICVTL